MELDDIEIVTYTPRLTHDTTATEEPPTELDFRGKKVRHIRDNLGGGLSSSSSLSVCLSVFFFPPLLQQNIASPAWGKFPQAGPDSPGERRRKLSSSRRPQGLPPGANCFATGGAEISGASSRARAGSSPGEEGGGRASATFVEAPHKLRTNSAQTPHNLHTNSTQTPPKDVNFRRPDWVAEIA